MRTVYIENNDAKAALSEYMARFAVKPEAEEVTLAESLGRVTAEAVIAKICDPVYNASAMDGIMVDAAKTYTASELTPVTLVHGRDFEFVNTGGQIKKEFNAVIMIEDCIREGDDVRIISATYPWKHVRSVGESIVYGEMLLPSAHKIRPADLGALASGGYKAVKVVKKPMVGIIPTGAELVENPEDVREGRLMESNSYVFEALVREYGGAPKKYPIVRDDYADLVAAIKLAVAENDIVALNAGTSAGTKDYTLKAVAELGEVFVHGIAVKPGKPTILGIVDGKPVLGIPGYPVSAYLMFEMFVRPIVLQMLLLDVNAAERASAVLSRRITSSFKNEEIIRTALCEVGGKLVATPLERGAAAVMSLVKADGKIIVDRLSEGIEAGETVSAELMRPLDEIRKKLGIIGSHDLIIDFIADRMPVSSAHVGSTAGITALKRGECHIAPVHLLDEETGVYNIPYVKKFAAGQKLSLIKVVERIQGFILPKGNPKNIQGFRDLAGGGMFANRQRGAGTRVLLDYNLKKENIAPEAILGYEKEFSTHLAVAIAVKTGIADVGLGVLSAARAMELDFVPVCSEDYDFLLPTEFIDDARVKKLLEIITSEVFKRKLDEISGYSYPEIGRIIEI